MVSSITLILKCGGEGQTNRYLQQWYGSVVQFVKDARLEWAGHVWKADNSFVKTVLVTNLNRKRSQGRSK